MEEDEELWERENEKFFLIINIINCLQKMEDQEMIGRANELLWLP